MSSGTKKFFFSLFLIIAAIGGAYHYNIYGTREVIDQNLIMVANLDKALLNNRSVAMTEARNLFESRIVSDREITEGCFAELLVPGWSFAIIDTSVTDTDKLEAYFCQSFVRRTTEYQIEYDIVGNFIRIREQTEL